MAGDWIKMRNDLADDPAVIAIAAELGIEEDHVVGKLHRLWSWADKQTQDGNALGVSFAWIDRYLSASGFASAMERSAWLLLRDGVLSFPNFDRHNSQTAKARALTAKRVARHKGNAKLTVDALPREEKRREEKSTPLPPSLSTSEAFREAWIVWQGHRKELRKPMTPRAAAMLLKKLAGWGPARAVAALENSVANGWQGVFEPESRDDLKPTATSYAIPAELQHMRTLSEATPAERAEARQAIQAAIAAVRGGE